MKRTFLLFAAGALLGSLAGSPAAWAAQPDRRPNIVLIFADDLGWQEPGYAGSDYCETPNLDRLAKEGLVFRHAYAAAGNCQPSRACMLSGQYTPRHHVYAVGSTKRGPVELMRMLPVPNASSLPLTTTTMGEAMQAAGYATGLFGKCHLAESEKGKSERRGFQTIAHDKHGFNSPDPADPKGIFALTSAACEFMEANRERPFFVYLPHFAVHSTLQSKSGTLEHFRDKQPGKLHDSPQHAACLADLDTGIGLLLQKLKDLNLEQNTLVMFTSDNGGTHVSQEPLRGAKGGYYEGGIRVPAIARWPGVVKPGSVCDVPIINLDFYPTFLSVAGAKTPPSSPLDGESLLPLLEGQPKLVRSSIFWHFPGYLNGPVPRGRDPVFRTRPVSVIRQGDWKLHLYHEPWLLDGGRENLANNQAVELYNLADDPGERRNLAQSNTREREQLLTDLLGWMDNIEAKFPTGPNPMYDAKAASAAPKKPKK